MTHFLKWSVPQVCSLAGMTTSAVMYIPGLGAFCLQKTCSDYHRVSGGKTEKLAKLYKEVEPFAPEIDALIIASTECRKGAEKMIKKIREAGV